MSALPDVSREVMDRLSAKDLHNPLELESRPGLKSLIEQLVIPAMEKACNERGITFAATLGVGLIVDVMDEIHRPPCGLGE